MNMLTNETRHEVRDMTGSYAPAEVGSEAVPAGFRRTEVGVIPADWLLRPLGEIAVVGSGGTPSRDDAANWNGSIPWITTSQIDFNVIRAAEQFLTAEGLKNSAAKLLPAGTLLLALYGQGKTRGKVALLGFSASTNQACASITPCGEISREFLLYFLTSRYEEIRAASNGGSQDNLNGRIVKELPIVIPPLAEQRAIAAALSDVDALLAKLDQLIAKKRDLKQAATQRLLSGTVRLRGFTEPWNSRTLQWAIESLDAGVSVNSVEGDADAQTDCILKTSAVANGRFLPNERKRIALQDVHRAKLNPLRGTLLISRMNTPELVGECGYVDTDYPHVFLPDRLWMTRIRSDAPVDVRWLAYLLSGSEYRKKIRAVATGTSGSMKNLAKEAFLSLSICYPSKKQQAAIATILSDMDAELAALEARRIKTQELKQGMMQALLTGRIRLL